MNPAKELPNKDPGQDALQSGSRGMVFLHHSDPRFLQGLEQHGMLGCHGQRVLSIGLSQKPFPACFGRFHEVRESGQLFNLDRIAGGAPYSDLIGIEELAQSCRTHPAFLGFQLHEWGHASVFDNLRIRDRFTRKDIPFNSENFDPYRNRSKSPYFSAGDYDVYGHLPREYNTSEALEAFFRDYYSYFAQRAEGQIMSVSGYFQFHHLAAEIGARSVVAEVGNQVPLTCMQVATARGAARQSGLPWGVYYEPWGGKPPSATSAMSWSPWFGEDVPLDQADQGLGLPMGSDLGSSRSLQKRLLIYSWLSGSAFVSEEWGPENYFSDWETYPLSEYGRIAKEFETLAAAFPRPEPLVPLALVLPPKSFGVDTHYLTAEDEDTLLYKSIPVDAFHRTLRVFAQSFLASRPHERGRDDSNLTPSPWIGTFDVLRANAAPSLLGEYALAVYFDPAQYQDSPLPSEKKLLYEGTSAQTAACQALVEQNWPVRVQGEVGCAMAKVGTRHIVGIFNNLGVLKEGPVESILPEATRDVLLEGDFHDLEILEGAKFLQERNSRELRLSLPGGKVFLALFDPNPR